MKKIMSKAEYDAIYDETGREFAEEFFYNSLKETMTFAGSTGGQKARYRIDETAW
jgi:hypothetical protein